MNAGLPKFMPNIAGTVTEVRGSPGTIVGGYVYNKQGSDGYLLFFDALATDVILGTTAPTYAIHALAFSSIDVCRAGEGIMFRNAISIAVVDTADVTTPPDPPQATAGLASDVALTIQ